MSKPCENCPFNSRGPGLRLRKALAPGRWNEILRALRNDQHFICHKTTTHDENDEHVPTEKDRLCAGAIAWQEKHGLSSNLQRVMENIDWIAKRRKERARG